MIDLQQIAMAVNSCMKRKLVVIDELGGGTDPGDGAGLTAGVFGIFYLSGPKLQGVATHFHEPSSSVCSKTAEALR